MKKKKRLKRKVAVQIIRKFSHESYAHIFDEAALSFQTLGIILKEQAIRQRELSHAKILIDYLENKSVSQNWILTLPFVTFYRIVDGPFHPLSCLGTFSHGGRLNLGTPQLTFDFNHKAEFGLYGSLELDTALAEFESSGLPSRANKIYKLNYLQKPIKLIEFDKAVNDLSSLLKEVPLRSIVSEIPYQAAWKYQKWPKLSQILGSWLRQFSSKDTAGILFDSTKRPGGKNIYLFFSDEHEEAKKRLVLEVM